MIRKHMPNGIDYRILCITDDHTALSHTMDIAPLWRDHDNLKNASGEHLPSCYRRLKLFDPETQELLGMKPGDRIMSVDTDAVILSSLKPVVTRKEPFVGWAVQGANHPRVFNGSLWLFSQGEYDFVWKEFNADRSPALARASGFLGSDQSWISYKLARREETAGFGFPVVQSYPRELMRRPSLPGGTCIVFFNGKRKPWHAKTQMEARWIKDHWRVP